MNERLRKMLHDPVASTLFLALIILLLSLGASYLFDFVSKWIVDWGLGR